MTNNLENITINGRLAAIVIRKSFQIEGIRFFTPNDFSQQLAYMKRPKKHQIPPHEHIKHDRKIVLTQETLFVRKGKVRVNLYGDKRKIQESVILAEGDVILLASGGHGFDFLEETELIEVKQGPYIEDEDKVRF